MRNINKYKQLEENQKLIRFKIIDYIIEKNQPIELNDVKKYIKNTTDLNDDYINQTLHYFMKNNIMVVDENKVNFIYPVSAHNTMHSVKLKDGRMLNAMCAIDALGVAHTFNQDINIKSMCNVTGKEINIKIRDKKIHDINNEDLRILHINLEKYENWAASC
ncbi:MerB-like organometallic lyase SaoL [Terrisporobacter sp.]|uniref:MerB-like organometallic lyase SaoL n=1 Tax=Terrisporobacter sp. TaxID=1965305 RepID=UPI002618DC09|nr:MerB-like organometallic lyase SaoL [Terrisporobacter sp.]